MLNSLAVLIDADNASAKTIDDVFKAIEKLGKISAKKIYGDWSMLGLSASWQDSILRHAIDPMQQFAYVKGKNATDIALVIEAMDLLHSGEYMAFVWCRPTAILQVLLCVFAKVALRCLVLVAKKR